MSNIIGKPEPLESIPNIGLPKEGLKMNSFEEWLDNDKFIEGEGSSYTINDLEAAYNAGREEGLKRAAEICRVKVINQDCMGRQDLYVYGKVVGYDIAAAIEAEIGGRDE